MKELFSKLDKVLEHRIRLAIMSLLVVSKKMDFNSLKEQLNLTDGNLASHIATLEKHKYLEVKKQFKGRKPHTTYLATDKGIAAFRMHLDALEAIIHSTTPKE